MADIIGDIEREMRLGTVGPHQAAEYKTKLAGEYSWIAGQLEIILARKPIIWLELRKKRKSDNSTDREYEMLEDGVNEIGLRLRMKRVTVLMSALSSLIRVQEGEAKSQW